MHYPNAQLQPVRNHGGPISQRLGLVLHVQQGDGSLFNYFDNPASQVSSHFWVSKTGTVEQYVDTDIMAWAQMAGNSTYLSVETEGYATEAFTDPQLKALAALYRWCHDNFAMPIATSDTPGQKGLAWHGMGGAEWGGHTGCPGDLRLAARASILSLASGSVIGAGPAPNPPSHTPTAPSPPQSPTAPPFPGQLLYLRQPYVSGNECRQWQQQMAHRGWSLTVDGIYGPQSENVCKQFQQEKGLIVDGVVGPLTWNKSWTAPVT